MLIDEGEVFYGLEMGYEHWVGYVFFWGRVVFGEVALFEM